MRSHDLHAVYNGASMTRSTTALICFVFAVSGAAALIFEALFFRLIGLILGNGVEAVAIVLASFMLGLALGNGLAARLGDRATRPFQVYAALELAVGACGLAIVIALPALPALLASFFEPLTRTPAALNAARAAVAFGLVMIPATAMGATLPILVRALSAHDPNFGRVLGRLYGWNTAGAVVGVLAPAGMLLASLGVLGTAVVAAGLELSAALSILGLSRGRETPRPPVTSGPKAPARSFDALLLAAAAGCGAALLALEVVWFRLFVLFEDAHAWSLAVMLAVVLAGIACGGLAAAAWFRRRPDAHRHAAWVAALAGVWTASSYTAFVAVSHSGAPARTALYLGLAFPVAFSSGVLFPMLGRSLQAAGSSPVRAAGRVTLANTLGSAGGSLLGGYVLLPRLGVEGSILWLALLYGLIALSVATATARHPVSEPLRRGPLLGALAALALVSLSFPTGALNDRILAAPGTTGAALRASGFERVALRESLLSTIQLYRKDLADQPYKWTLVTNAHMMSGESLLGRRFRKLYTYLPAALHPQLRSALLISYGVGSTAESLVEQRSLERIDVVDISSEVLEVAALRFPPGTDPLDDPRVHTHVEDGRYFLLTTDRRYDLITAEPPPPRQSGVETLYSAEFFQSVYARLADGGFATYWLPVYQLEEDEAKSIVAAFCAAFESCSLWIGAGLEWMLVGVREPFTSPTSESFTRPWRNPAQQDRLADIGLPSPAHLGALYIADGERLQDWVGDTPPLEDDHPHRIRPSGPTIGLAQIERYADFMNHPDSGAAFSSSEVMTRLWPEPIRAQTAEWFPLMRIAQRFVGWGWDAAISALHHSFELPRLAPYRSWIVDGGAVAERIVAGADEPAALRGELSNDLTTQLAFVVLERGDVERAARLLDATLRTPLDLRGGKPLVHVYLLLRLGEVARAERRLREIARTSDPASQERLDRVVRRYREWFGLAPGFAAPSGAGPPPTARTSQD